MTLTVTVSDGTVADGGAMWIVGDWGQASPWSRNTGVKMVKGNDGTYTGELTLLEGTEFDVKIVKSTVSTTSGGINKWSATRFKSTLNESTSYSFGEFTDNLVPNGDFEGAEAQWTPLAVIIERDNAHGGGKVFNVNASAGHPVGTSDVFVIPPNQSLTLSFYMRTSQPVKASISVKDVDTQSILFKEELQPAPGSKWIAVSGVFESDSTPVRAQIVCRADDGFITLDDMSLVSV